MNVLLVVRPLSGPVASKKGVVTPNPVMRPNDNPLVVPGILLPNGNLLFAIESMSKQEVYQKGSDLLVSAFSNLAQ